MEAQLHKGNKNFLRKNFILYFYVTLGEAEKKTLNKNGFIRILLQVRIS